MPRIVKGKQDCQGGQPWACCVEEEMNEFLSACRMKSFGNDGIVGFADGKVAGGSICRYDPERNALRSLFIDGYQEGCIERPRVVRVKHLQAFDNAIAYQEFAVDPNLP